MKTDIQESFQIEEYLTNLITEICDGHPIRKRWFSKFYEFRMDIPESNMDFDTFCIMMERDDKLNNLVK